MSTTREENFGKWSDRFLDVFGATSRFNDQSPIARLANRACGRLMTLLQTAGQITKKMEKLMRRKADEPLSCSGRSRQKGSVSLDEDLRKGGRQKERS